MIIDMRLIMSDAVQDIKAYIQSPEGAEWFMNAVKNAQELIRTSNENKETTNVVHGTDIKTKLEEATELHLEKRERNIKTLVVSKRELERVIQWTEKHPSKEKDGRYILKVTSSGSKTILKSILLMKGEGVSNSQLITEDPKKILSGDITWVTTRGAQIESYHISLID
jgi:hypothetical protein